MLKTLLTLGAVALVAASYAQTGLNASGSIAYTQTAGVYTYDITLNNIGTTTIGTLWYAWIPGEHYLPSAPTSTSGPAGWTITTTHPAGSDYAVRWERTAAGSLLQPGTSLSGFTFTTTLTPTELLGPSRLFGGKPIGTSWVYEGARLVGPGRQLLINPVPEPACLLGLAGGLAVLMRRKRCA